MSDDIKITVTGTSLASQKAERATMHIRVSSEGHSQSKVAADVTSTSAALQELFKGLAYTDDDGDVVADAQVSEWSMGALSTGSYQPWSDDTEKPKARIYTASITFDARFRDFKEFGKITAQLLERPHVSIDSISWDLTVETRAALAKKTRRGAVEDAVAKAEDYAGAAGRFRVVPLEISDQIGAGGAERPPLMLARARGGGGEPELNFTPETINVESAVVVKFAATWQ